MYGKLKLKLDEISRISLNRPEKKNALDLQLLKELGEAVGVVKNSEARVLVVRGEGDTFCSGLDLDLLAELASQKEEKLREQIAQAQHVIYELRNLKSPC